MSMRDLLAQAMRLPTGSDTIKWLSDRGVSVSDQDTMSHAVHEIYCGAKPDHDQPNERDQQQAIALLASATRFLNR